MINKKLYPILGLMILHFVSISSIATGASTDGTHTLRLSTFGITATKTIGAEYQVAGTLGQAVSGHDYQSTSYTLNVGFWQGYLLPVMAGDLNDDGRVDLEDVIGGLRALTEQSSEATKEADVDGDGKLSPAELIHIMRKQAHIVE